MILWRCLLSILNEVDQAIARTTFSTILSEIRDFACILTDRHGASLCPVCMELTQFLCGSAPDRPGVAAPLPGP